jgi:hypothetical protein
VNVFGHKVSTAQPGNAAGEIREYLVAPHCQSSFKFPEFREFEVMGLGCRERP